MSRQYRSTWFSRAELTPEESIYYLKIRMLISHVRELLDLYLLRAVDTSRFPPCFFILTVWANGLEVWYRGSSVW